MCRFVGIPETSCSIRFLAFGSILLDKLYVLGIYRKLRRLRLSQISYPCLQIKIHLLRWEIV